MLVLLLLLPLQSVAAAAGLSEQDEQCLACHGTDGLEKALADGEALSLHVAAPAFAESVHSPLGCTGCHADVTLENHPPAAHTIASRRTYSIAQAEICRQCHEDKFTLYEGSVHASLVRDGNPLAPVCTSCHAPHAVRKSDRMAIAQVPCRQCHADIFNAYAGSVHGHARSRSAESNAPLCADCHRAHDVTAPTAGEQVKQACLGCHAGTLASHQAWLPHAERHLETVACPACHVPGAQRRIALRLYDNVSRSLVAEKRGVPQFVKRALAADATGQGLDALALQSLLREFNREGADDRTTLRGRLELRNGVEAHQLASRSKATRNCGSCHREGADPFQVVTVSIVGPDGRPLRYGARKEVLHSVMSVESMGGFYAIGGTRIKVLDWLFLGALVGGVGVPLGHLSMKWLFRKNPPAAGGTPGGKADAASTEENDNGSA
jgi:hypothetical protein